jgi:chromosome segregation ATPase
MRPPSWSRLTPLLLILLCGCGPNQKDLAEHRLRERIAEVKVHLASPNPNELRAQRLSVAARVEADQKYLTQLGGDLKALQNDLLALDALFEVVDRRSSSLKNVEEEIQREISIRQNRILESIDNLSTSQRTVTAVQRLDLEKESLREQIAFLEAEKKKPLSQENQKRIADAQLSLTNAMIALRAGIGFASQKCDSILSKLSE